MKKFIIGLSVLILAVIALFSLNQKSVAVSSTLDVYQTFSQAGVQYGGIFSNFDSLNTMTSSEFDASWLKGRTVHTIATLISPATDDADTARFIFDGAMRLTSSSSSYDWFPCDTILMSSKQAETYKLYVNSFAGRFDIMRIRVVNSGRAKTVPDVNRSGKTVEYCITSDGTNFTGSYGRQWH